MSIERELTDGRPAHRATVGDFPGFELLVPTEGEAPGSGALCRTSDGKEFSGIAAYRTGSNKTKDPYQLAVLAMTVLERGVAGKDP